MSSSGNDEKQRDNRRHETLLLLARLIAKEHKSRQQDTENNVLPSNYGEGSRKEEGSTNGLENGSSRQE